MRRGLILIGLSVGIALAAGCVERTRPGTQVPGNSGGTTEPQGRIPDVRRDDGVYLRTDTLRYRLRREPTVLAVDIPYTYVNPRARTIYLPACRADQMPPPPALEQERTPDKWVRAWSPDTRNCRTSLLLPLEMAPGQVLVDTLHVRAPYAPDSITAFSVDPVQGVYRLVWRVLSDYDTAVAGYGPLLPVTERLSNRFVLDPP